MADNPFLQPLIAFDVDDEPRFEPVPQDHAAPPPSTHAASDIDQLAAIFPNYDRELLAVILESSDNDLEAAVRALLEMEHDTPPDVSLAALAADEQLTVDEQMAIQLSQEFAQEEEHTDESPPQEHDGQDAAQREEAAARVDEAVARTDAARQDAERRTSQSSILGPELTNRIKEQYSALVAKLSQPARARVGLLDGAVPLLVGGGAGGASMMGPVAEPDMSIVHSTGTRAELPTTVASPLLVRS